MIKYNSIWSTIEYDCISRDFNYDSYLEFYSRTKTPAAPVNKEAYYLLLTAFNLQLEEEAKT